MMRRTGQLRLDSIGGDEPGMAAVVRERYQRHHQLERQRNRKAEVRRALAKLMAVPPPRPRRHDDEVTGRNDGHDDN